MADLGFSVTVVASDRSLPVSELARAIEERGLNGMWLPDHSHIPVGERAEARLHDPRHRNMLDPLIGLAAAAAATERIRVGTGVLLAAQRDPIQTAKALASIDVVSRGRLDVGVGYGWSRAEMADHGVDPDTRRGVTREHVLAMQAIWSEAVAEYSGTHVSFGPTESWPKPVQQPLPVLLGSALHPQSVRDIAEWCAGWIPLGGRGLSERVALLRSHLGPDRSCRIVCFTDAGLDLDKFVYLQRSGSTEVAIDIPHEDPVQVIEALDRVAAVVEKFRRR